MFGTKIQARDIRWMFLDAQMLGTSKLDKSVDGNLSVSTGSRFNETSESFTACSFNMRKLQPMELLCGRHVTQRYKQASGCIITACWPNTSVAYNASIISEIAVHSKCVGLV